MLHALFVKNHETNHKILKNYNLIILGFKRF